MNELLFFVLGLVIGALVAVVVMCLNRIKYFDKIEKELILNNNVDDKL
jgi:hypothetical protein